MMKINYDRVVELLQSPEEKKAFEAVFLQDVMNIIEHKQPGLSVAVIAHYICSDRSMADLIKDGPLFPAAEMGEFLVAHLPYVKEIYRRLASGIKVPKRSAL